MTDQRPLKVGDMFEHEAEGVFGKVTNVMKDAKGEQVCVVVEAPCGCCWFTVDLRQCQAWESHAIH